MRLAVLVLIGFCAFFLLFWPSVEVTGQPSESRLPSFCREERCLPTEDWKLVWLTSETARTWLAYDVGLSHLRQEELLRWSGEVSLFLQDGSVLKAQGFASEEAAYGCQGKESRLRFVSDTLPKGMYRGVWGVITSQRVPPREGGTSRAPRGLLKSTPAWLGRALERWKLPWYATGATAQSYVIPIELDGDGASEYWVTRVYRRTTYETPAPRMYTSWAIFDGVDTQVLRWGLEEEEDCDCLCRDGGCGCCPWQDVTIQPVAAFDLDNDGMAELVVERHSRPGVYRYELWRFDGKKFEKTNLFYEDGGC